MSKALQNEIPKNQKSEVAYIAMTEELLNSIRHGDKVKILVPNGIGRDGQEWTAKVGTAVMRGPAGWVLNMGGKHGTPGIATVKNLISVRKASKA